MTARLLLYNLIFDADNEFCALEIFVDLLLLRLVLDTWCGFGIRVFDYTSGGFHLQCCVLSFTLCDNLHPGEVHLVLKPYVRAFRRTCTHLNNSVKVSYYNIHHILLQ